MKELIVVSSVAVLVFLLSGGVLGWGVVRRRKDLRRTAYGLFVLFLGLAGWVGFSLITKSYHKVTEAVRPRTGDEIYAALFGQKQAACVRVLRCQDQVIPKIDYAIWLQFETCPKELGRILKLHHFTRQKQPTAGWNTDGPVTHQKWFKPENLGDSVLVFTYQKDNYGSGQTLYASADSTRVFCVDFSE